MATRDLLSIRRRTRQRGTGKALGAERFEEAIAICELWADGMPGEVGPLFSLARTCRTMGSTEQAISTYEKILTLVPEGRQADNARRALAELRGGAGPYST
jgi:hypothetical protein